MSGAATLVRTARHNAGLTQTELAQRAGMTQSAVARMESADWNPTMASLERVLRALDQELQLTPMPGLPEVDEAQIESQLRMSPAQRLAHHDVARRNLRKLVRTAKRVSR